MKTKHTNAEIKSLLKNAIEKDKHFLESFEVEYKSTNYVDGFCRENINRIGARVEALQDVFDALNGNIANLTVRAHID